MSQIACKIPFATGYPGDSYVVIEISPIRVPVEEEEILFHAKDKDIETRVKKVQHFFIAGDSYMQITTDPYLISKSKISELVADLSEEYHVHDSKIPSE